jgi:hypothetical protein
MVWKKKWKRKKINELAQLLLDAYQEGFSAAVDCLNGAFEAVKKTANTAPPEEG